MYSRDFFTLPVDCLRYSKPTSIFLRIQPWNPKWPIWPILFWRRVYSKQFDIFNHRRCSSSHNSLWGITHHPSHFLLRTLSVQSNSVPTFPNIIYIRHTCYCLADMEFVTNGTSGTCVKCFGLGIIFKNKCEKWWFLWNFSKFSFHKITQLSLFWRR